MQDAVKLGKSPDTYRLGLKAIPMFMFNYYDNEYTPLGMFNFIPNKNEVEYLGFTNTGLKTYTFEASRAQSWEIRDNNILWDFYLNPTGKDSEGNIVNDVENNIELIKITLRSFITLVKFYNENDLDKITIFNTFGIDTLCENLIVC